MTEQPPGGAHGPAGRGKGGGVGGWIKRNKGPAIALGALGLVGVVTIAKNRSSSSTAGTSTTGATSQTGVQPGVYGYGGDSTGQSYDAEMSQLQELLNSYTAGTLGAQLFPNGMPQGSTSSSSSKPPPSPTYTASPKPPILTKSWTPAQKITVPAGASLLSLSKKYLGTSNRAELAHANGIGTGAGLRAGQQLIIPAH